MDEAEFWKRLEFRLCDELGGMDAKEFRRLWCDGLVAQQYLLEEDVPRIVGYAWMMTDSRGGSQYDFVLFLPRHSSREALDWSSLLPPNNATEWLEIELPVSNGGRPGRRHKKPRGTISIHPTYVARA
jgi:hypothetical protein